MINPGHSYPGARPLTDGQESLAAAALDVFLAEVREQAVQLEQITIRHRVAGVDGPPERATDADRDGWFAWTLPMSDGTAVPVLIPGVALAQMRDDHSSQAPCLYVRDDPWPWRAAVDMVASEGMRLPDKP